MSSAVDTILDTLPIDDIAQRFGISSAEAKPVVSDALEALLSGMSANANDPAAAESLVKALPKHNNDLLKGGVSLDDVDTTDGGKIVKNVFGDQADSVASALGSRGSAGNTSLFQQLLPVLAPVVMAFLAKTFLGGGSSDEPDAETATGGGLGDLLGSVLGGSTSGSKSGGGLGDLLGGILGGGGTGNQSETSGGLGDLLGGILGSGGSQSSTGGLGDLLGGLLGGGKR